MCRNNSFYKQLCLGIVFLMAGAVYSHAQATGENINFTPAKGIVAVGNEINAQLAPHSIYRQPLKAGQLYGSCYNSEECFEYKVDNGDWTKMPLGEIAITLPTSLLPRDGCLEPGSHSIHIMHIMPYCIHTYSSKGENCSGKLECIDSGHAEFNVVRLDKLRARDKENSQVNEDIDNTSLGFALDQQSDSIPADLIIPVEEENSTIKITPYPFPNVDWPSAAPFWGYSLIGVNILRNPDGSLSVESDYPSVNTYTAKCGESTCQISIMVVGVNSITYSNEDNAIIPDFLTMDAMSGTLRIIDENSSILILPCSQSKELLIQAEANPFFQDEDNLPSEWQFTVNDGNSTRKCDSRTTHLLNIQSPGQWEFVATCGASRKQLTVIAAGVDILGDVNRDGAIDNKDKGDDAYGNEMKTNKLGLIVPAVFEDDSEATRRGKLVPVEIIPKGLDELSHASIGFEDIDQAIGMIDFCDDGVEENGHLHISGTGQVALWFDAAGTKECTEDTELPIDKITTLYVEGHRGAIRPSDAFSNTVITVKYEGNAFYCEDSLNVTIANLRPEMQCKYLLLNDDNDDAGAGKSPKDSTADMDQTGKVDKEDDLKAASISQAQAFFDRFKEYIDMTNVSFAITPDNVAIWLDMTKGTELEYASDIRLDDIQDNMTFWIEGIKRTSYPDQFHINCTWQIDNVTFTESQPVTVLQLYLAVASDHPDSLSDAALDFLNLGIKDSNGNFGNTRCVFWVNDDYDALHYQNEYLLDKNDWLEDDTCDTGTTSCPPNCTDDVIGFVGNHFKNSITKINGKEVVTRTEVKPPIDYCLRDLEDFNRLQIKLDSQLEKLPKITVSLADAPINIFKAIDATTSYLSSKDIAIRQAKEKCMMRLSSNTECTFDTDKLDFNNVMPFIWEASKAGKYDLKLKITIDNQEIGYRKVRLVLKDIASFYDSWDLSSITSETIKKNTSCESVITDEYILFVHGFNVTSDEKQLWAATIAKRLWWQKFRGRFGFAQWNCILASLSPEALKAALNGPFEEQLYMLDMAYTKSDLRAWNTGVPLKILLSNLQNSYCKDKVNLIAHSQGTVVACEALRLLPPKDKINCFIATQGALTSSCFEKNSLPATQLRTDTIPDVIGEFPSWQQNDPFMYALKNNAKATKMYNLVNTQDYALKSSEFTNWRKNNEMHPNAGVVYLGNNFYYNGKKMQLPEKTDDYSCPVGRDTYIILAFGAPAWGMPIGCTFVKDYFINESIKNIMDVDSHHYSHSKQMRSNIVDTWDYWELITNHCK